MTRDNVFYERERFKKRLITASITEDQRAALDKLKAARGIKSDGGIIKLALAEMIDREEQR